MSQVHEFCLGGYLLKVNPFAYLVEVDINPGTRSGNIRSEHAPDWIFDSRHAIWLTVEELPIKDRALHGDQIREQLKESP